jgi:excinuclease ABC subunit C
MIPTDPPVEQPPEAPMEPGMMPEPPMKGVAVIEAAMATMPANPGVYRMLDHKGDALYVGKARSLKRRVLS